MSITILGQHIRLIRPKKIKIPIIRNGYLPQAKYDTRPSGLIKVNIDWVRDSITVPSEPKYYLK